jgi:uncharacterized membrane protein YfcA
LRAALRPFFRPKHGTKRNVVQSCFLQPYRDKKILSPHFPFPPLPTAAFLFFAAIVAGALNSVAGGGSFITFPSLIFTGMAPIPANATNTAALWPGTVASTFAYRKEFDRNTLRLLLPLATTCLIGSLIGAWVLLHTPPSTFVKLIPWLLLIATVIFASSAKITAKIRSRTTVGTTSPLWIALGLLLQLIIAIYVGYFGAGAGILVLALLALMGMQNIHAMNGVKTVLVGISNGVAIITFIWHGIVIWPQTILMLVGGLIGGYGGAHLAQKMNPQHVRWAVIAIGLSMSVYFFIHG